MENFKLRKCKCSVSVFVPVYNEAKNICLNIQFLQSSLEKIGCLYEIIVVDDASTDTTIQALSGLVKNDNRLRILRYETGPSRRENLASSFEYAKYDLIVFTDCDLINTFDYISDLVLNLLSGNDIVIASRYLKDSKIKRNIFRLFLSKIYLFLIRICFRLDISDFLCGFKAFKRDVLLDLVKEMGYDNSFKRGIFWDAELLIRAKSAGYKIKEIPVVWFEGGKSSLNFSHEKGMFFYIIKFMFKFAHGKNKT
ncbi:MAG: glycosyltransferase family 2 protein [Candidatus Omnitrophica bacterium]|nr:glycosyltransferase family 2 protein [Candidatus Omnitrophota bacterium]